MTSLRSARPIILLTAASVALAGCGWMNPKHWFPSNTAPTLEPEGGYIKKAQDSRQPVAQITDLKIERTLTGAIVFATGLPPTQGWWQAGLVAENDGLPVDGVVTYHFVVSPPPAGSPDAARTTPPPLREVTAGANINATRLANTHKIVVIAATNSRAVSR